MSDRILRLLIGYPAFTLSAFIVVTSFLAWQARDFEIDASAETLLTRDNNLFINTQLVNQKFTPDEFLLLVYRPLDHELFSSTTYENLRHLTAEIERLERVKSTQSILTVPLLSGNLADVDLTTDPAELTFENADLENAEFRNILADHPLYSDLIINEGQTATAIQISFHANEELDQLEDRIIDIQRLLLDGELTVEQERELEALQEQAEPVRQRLAQQRYEEISFLRELGESYAGEADIYLGGAHVLGFQLEEIISSDLLIFGSAVAVMICIVLLVVFRHLRWVLIPVICCACSVVATVGLLAMLGLKATVISANFVALQLILTLALVVHLIVQYRELSFRKEGHEQQRESVGGDVGNTVKAKAAPCLYAGLTTSVGFTSLLLSDIQPVIAFGYMMILAMAVSIVVSLILFPNLMMMLKTGSEKRRQGLSQKFVRLLESGVLRRPVAIVIVFCIGSAALMAGIFRLDVENSFLNYFADDTQVHRELSFIDQEFGGSTPLDVVYRYRDAPGEEDLVLTAENVQRMEAVQDIVTGQQGMGKVLSVPNFVAVAKEVNGGLPLTEYELSTVYYLMEDSLREDLLGSFLANDSHEVRISGRVKDSTPDLERRKMLENLRQELTAVLPEDADLRLTNLFVLYQDILQKLARSQVNTLVMVFAVLGIVFALVFRSVKIAVLALTPNILSTASILGIMGWLDIPLDLMTITIAAIAMGIAVDDTIHYVHRYKEEVGKENADPDRAIGEAHNSVGYAIVYTSVIVALGFAMLSFSDFVPSIYFGLLTGAAMLMAMVSNLTLLPVLLRRFVTAG